MTGLYLPKGKNSELNKNKFRHFTSTAQITENNVEKIECHCILKGMPLDFEMNAIAF